MSGHSKWSTIKHKKAALDAKRGGVFTKMAKAISVAVKKGGGVGDPAQNFALRLAIDRARAVNMPKETVDRAIDKGMGKGSMAEMEELVLEGYGQGGTPLVMDAVTDNRNRTISEVKNILEKNGGRLGEPGSVLYQFDRVGAVDFEGEFTEQLELALIDLGLIDYKQDGRAYRLYVPADKTHAFVSYLETLGVGDVSGSLIYRPKADPAGTHENPAFEKLLSALDDHDDIQEVYAYSV